VTRIERNGAQTGIVSSLATTQTECAIHIRIRGGPNYAPKLKKQIAVFEKLKQHHAGCNDRPYLNRLKIDRWSQALIVDRWSPLDNNSNPHPRPNRHDGHNPSDPAFGFQGLQRLRSGIM